MTKDITTFVFLMGFSFLFAQNRTIPVDTLVMTAHNTTVKGQNFSYTAEPGPPLNDIIKGLLALFFILSLV